MLGELVDRLANVAGDIGTGGECCEKNLHTLNEDCEASLGGGFKPLIGDRLRCRPRTCRTRAWLLRQRR